MLITEYGEFQSKCTGCYACENICTQNAIQLKLDGEGFFYPHVNDKLCIHCDQCSSACMLNPDIVNIKEDEEYNNSKIVYSVQSDKYIRNKSSSGGAFYQLANIILKKGGIVYGAVYDKENKIVVHTNTDHTDLEKILRSKYVQSKIGDIYKDVKEQLKKQRYVLFCGTPCQVQGLKLYLKNRYEKLFTVDFVCHGVPSTGVFNDMIKLYEKKQGSQIQNVTFREKDLGWRKIIVKYYFQNKNVLKEIPGKYCYLFLSNISLRKSCYTCNMPESHVSDITIWDDWEMQHDDDTGVSALHINTEKGEKIFDEIKCYFKILRTSEKENYKIYFFNHGKRKEYKKIKTRTKFFEFYQKYGIEDTLNVWYPRFYKKNMRVLKIKKFLIGYREKLKKILEG